MTIKPPPGRDFAILADQINRAFQALATNPLPLASYTLATVPDATVATGSLIYVSDESGGAVPSFSDGTNWRRVTDRAIIS